MAFSFRHKLRSVFSQTVVKPRAELAAEFAWVASNQIAVALGAFISSKAGSFITNALGFVLNNGYLVVDRTVPSLYATQWSEFGTVFLDSSNNLTTIGTRADGQSVIFKPTSPNVDMVMWGKVDVNITGGTLPTGIVHYAARRSGSSHSVWLNGKLYGTASDATTPGASTGVLPALGAQAGSGANAGNGPLTATNGLLAVIRTSSIFSDGYYKRASENTAALFEPIKKRAVKASGANTYTLNISGGITFSGAVALLRTRAQVPAGGLTFSGSAPNLRTRIQVPAGGIQFSGSSNLLRTRVQVASGGITFSGSAPITFTPAGGSTVTPQRTLLGVGT